MNNAEILGNKLYELRKNANLSQEEFADKIGVSRQAVSKWERGEALPDTDNLINIVRLYGISLDELIDNEQPKNEEKFDNGKQESFAEEDEDNNVKIEIDEDYISVTDENGEVCVSVTPPSISIEANRPKSKMLRILYDLPYPIVVTVAYLLWGFLSADGHGWAVGWTLFITIPVYYSVVDCIRNKSLSEFCYPVFVTFIYCLAGMLWGLWHPLWIIFITIPIFEAVVSIKK